MTFRTASRLTLTLAAATLLAGAVQADELRPARAASLDLGPLAGIAYYTAEPDGHHVVVTLAPRAAAPASRVEAVLASGQSLTVSTPRQDGAAARTVTITRRGETTTVEAVAIRSLDSAALN
ncbi:hypothetical protein [Methylobacterium aquaticum]|uniref:hypothetical protein n=1 Tax=Methylobacterium aquaticum TaxID=270351 RepID=UPI001931C446|nr:hypothetical protein [Methylobacterium aquaticum]QRE75598.1 hypothetical protein F1D61_20250 [Methylobacterium aquaticum]